VLAVIRFLVTYSETPSEIHRQLVFVHNDIAMSRNKVVKWRKELKRGRINDKKRSCRPSVRVGCSNY